jgi:signal transduction histidine kinase
VQRRFITLREASVRWHEDVDAFLARANDPIAPRRPAPTAGQYEDVLVAAAQLDDAITRAGYLHRQRIIEAERIQMRLTWLLLLMGMLALVMTAWVGRRLRGIATEAECRRQEIERLMEAKARLVRGLSHDLRNPLNVIYSHAQLLEDGVIGEPSAVQQKSLAHIRRSVRAMLGLLEDLLELWRAETGELRAAPARTDLEEVVRDVAEAYRAVAEAAGHRLELEVTAGLPPLETDGRRVRQILGNLVSNAVKYTPSGGRITIRLSSRSGVVRSRRGRWVVIAVTDTGPGIPPDKVETVFEEFTRLRPSVPGVGLGLAISRRIARMLGGDITAETGRQGGATFVLSLPLLARAHDRLTSVPGHQRGMLHETMAR